MLAPHLFIIVYCGDETHGKVEFEKTGGTSAGKLILTEGTDAEEFDLGSSDYNTLTKLEAAVNALDMWEIHTNPNFDHEYVLSTANFDQRPLADTAETNAVKGDHIYCGKFEEEYETIAGDSEVRLQTPLLFDVRYMSAVAIVVEAQGTDGAANEECELYLAALRPEQDLDVPPVNKHDYEYGRIPDTRNVDWDKSALMQESVEFYLDGTDAVMRNRSIEVNGVEMMFVDAFRNGNANEVKVKVFI